MGGAATSRNGEWASGEANGETAVAGEVGESVGEAAIEERSGEGGIGEGAALSAPKAACNSESTPMKFGRFDAAGEGGVSCLYLGGGRLLQSNSRKRGRWTALSGRGAFPAFSKASRHQPEQLAWERRRRRKAQTFDCHFARKFVSLNSIERYLSSEQFPAYNL